MGCVFQVTQDIQTLVFLDIIDIDSHVSVSVRQYITGTVDRKVLGRSCSLANSASLNLSALLHHPMAGPHRLCK